MLNIEPCHLSEYRRRHCCCCCRRCSYCVHFNVICLFVYLVYFRWRQPNRMWIDVCMHRELFILHQHSNKRINMEHRNGNATIASTNKHTTHTVNVLSSVTTKQQTDPKITKTRLRLAIWFGVLGKFCPKMKQKNWHHDGKSQTKSHLIWAAYEILMGISHVVAYGYVNCCVFGYCPRYITLCANQRVLLFVVFGYNIIITAKLHKAINRNTVDNFWKFRCCFRRIWQWYCYCCCSNFKLSTVQIAYLDCLY